MFSKLIFFATFIQQVAIDQKLKEAPDNRYSIGIFIGEMLPFVILIGLAYFFFYLARKRRNKDL